MKDFIIKLEITNSRNDDKTIKWNFFETEKEREDWILVKTEEQRVWNYDTIGAVSHRYYDFIKYSKSDILKLDILDLEGMSVGDFLSLIKDSLL